jgi:hypothetical protein
MRYLQTSMNAICLQVLVDETRVQNTINDETSLIPAPSAAILEREFNDINLSSYNLDECFVRLPYVFT